VTIDAERVNSRKIGRPSRVSRSSGSNAAPRNAHRINRCGEDAAESGWLLAIKYRAPIT